MQTSKLYFIGLTVAVALFLAVPVQLLQAQPVADILILRMAPVDGAAVVKLSGRQPKLVRVGDDLYGWGTVRGISADRLVIEQTGATGSELIVIRLRDNEQTIERIGQVIQTDQSTLRSNSKRPRSSWEDSD